MLSVPASPHDYITVRFLIVTERSRLLLCEVPTGDGMAGHPLWTHHQLSELMHEAGEDKKMQSCQRCSEPFIIASQAPEAGAQAKPRSTTQRHGKSTKPRQASGNLTTANSMPWATASAVGCSPARWISSALRRLRARQPRPIDLDGAQVLAIMLRQPPQPRRFIPPVRP